MLLFDQNLSYKLCKALAGVFPGCQHVREAGLSIADDVEVWNFAAANGLIIVPKDQDFRQRALLLGPPPNAFGLDLAIARPRTSPTRLNAAPLLSGIFTQVRPGF